MPASLRASIEQFARDLLATIAGSTSVTLNRLAISHATEDNGLGAIVLENGRFTMGKRLKPVLEAGRDARLLQLRQLRRRRSGRSSAWSCAMCRSGCCWATS